ncbi:histidine kinase [Salmonella enterica subsp. enterica serovar Heidelberg]|nr:histidine kinase [Salmonella enterica subsp. enterica serovar Heidelberg]
MRFKISLTTRLSLIFSAVMLTVWWLSSFILISTLNGYFDNQDRDFLTGKLQLTEEFLKEGANKQVISSQADSLIKISRIWADFFPANTSNQPI